MAPQAHSNNIPALLRFAPATTVVLGVATAGFLLLYGPVLEVQMPVPHLMWVLAPTVVLAVLAGQFPNHPARAGLYAAAPFAIGVVMATTLFGTYLIDSIAWWIGGAVVSIFPFVLAAACARRIARGGSKTA